MLGVTRASEPRNLRVPRAFQRRTRIWNGDAAERGASLFKRVRSLERSRESDPLDLLTMLADH